MNKSDGGNVNPAISRRKLILMGGGGAAVMMTSASLAAAVTYPNNDLDLHGKAPMGLTSGGVAADNSNARPAPAKLLSLVGTDGWVSMPKQSTPLAPYWPDTWAEDGMDTYVFGFRDVTGLDQDAAGGQKGHVQVSAPIIEVTAGEELWLTLTNVGLQMRPDLTDSHTMHWHGFRNAIPFYDGVPETSISVPIGRQFSYVFRPTDPGTYMYHCHFEDVEHVTMGMTGIVFVRPADTAGAPLKQAYDDPTTAFDREYAIILTEIDSRAHFNDAHILVTDWTDFRANFWLMNGRAYPDTIMPGAPFDTAPGANHGKPARNADNTLMPATITTAADGATTIDRLANQPLSSRIVCAEGETVLLRLVNLGFQQMSLSLPGIEMRTVGKDARPMGPARETKGGVISIAPGESRDVLFTAPATGRYPFYNRDLARYPGRGAVGAVQADQWSGGQRTEVTVLPAGLPAQQFTNHWEPSWLPDDFWPAKELW